eukprot:CAMPEP_0181310256 /NCGR_PEP_ID=MMETSP1101-20121128/12486_1 /TAXON_ID=46948 /ORGANISM="Rhodomonas abbreviata, Strain Caron Lab Isolate" /LENGTH=97 /DNA_ID=CAMNT_0023416867 /DNA_START=106 /DNA_END=396 /DNA_ORIENTATION=-
MVRVPCVEVASGCAASIFGGATSIFGCGAPIFGGDTSILGDDASIFGCGASIHRGDASMFFGVMAPLMCDAVRRPFVGGMPPSMGAEGQGTAENEVI